MTSEQTSNQNLTGKKGIHEKGKELTTIQSKSVEESSTQSNQMKSLYRRFTRGFLLAFLVNLTVRKMALSLLSSFLFKLFRKKRITNFGDHLVNTN
jgi:hypothetical protein